MKMYRFLALILVLVMLAGCNAVTESSVGTEETKGTEATKGT